MTTDRNVRHEVLSKFFYKKYNFRKHHGTQRKPDKRTGLVMTHWLSARNQMFRLLGRFCGKCNTTTPTPAIFPR